MKKREEESVREREREKRTHSQAKCFDHKNTAWSTGNQTVINFCPKCRKAVQGSPLHPPLFLPCSSFSVTAPFHKDCYR